MTAINIITILAIVIIFILWKLKKIYIRFNFVSNSEEQTKDLKAHELLKEIDKEITIAAQAFFAWKSIHGIASKDKGASFIFPQK